VFETLHPDPPAPARERSVPPVESADALLEAYRPADAFLLSSSRATLLAEGVYFQVPPSLCAHGPLDGLDNLPARVDRSLGVALAAGHPCPVVVGAVPFDPATPDRLAVPRTVRRAGPLPASGAPGPRRTAARPQRYAVTPVPPEADYAETVGRVVARLRAGEAAKVVLARSLRLEGPARPDLPALLRRLARRDPSGYTFAADLGAGATLVGSSPELLVSRNGAHVVANPLAGSLPRSPDEAEDRDRAARLLASAKDRHEHAVVVDAVAAALRPWCARLDVPAAPSLVRTAAMWHLSTRVTGTLADPATSALALATALHPTPAVCGSPPQAARAAIAECEPFDRGFYTGMVGWQDVHGDGEWVVTIRCAVAEPGALTLYAGAGVVAGSDPRAELAETSAKFRTLLDALELT
jgi:isochorismate synthase